MKILIAEDEVATAKAVKLMLEKAKCSVEIVHNGNDAWSKSVTVKPWSVL